MKRAHIITLLFFATILFCKKGQAQLFTGSTAQFNGYQGTISIGKPATALFNGKVNLFIERDTAGAGLYVGNGFTGNNASAINAISLYGKSLEASTMTGYGIYAKAWDPSGYAGYFDGNTFAKKLSIGDELQSPSLILGDFNQATTSLRVQASGSYGYDIANFQAGNNSLLFVGKSLAQGYNNITRANDLALIFSDGLNNAGSNLNSGITIAPWSHSNQPRGLRINSEGKVGIGVSEPEQSLDIAGGLHASEDAHIEGDLQTDNIVFDSQGSGLGFFSQDLQTHQGSKQLRAALSTEGWLGLGAGSPISPLELQFDGAGKTRSAISIVTTDPANDKSQISFRNTAGEKMAIGTDPDGNGEYAFFVYNGDLGKRAITVKASDNSTRILGNLVIGDQVTTAGSVSYSDRLSIDGTMVCKGARVTMKGWHDYVFEPDYQLPTLKEVASYIEAEGHLPGIPSEAEVLAEGVELGEMQGLLLKKIEELTLYVIELENQVNQLKSSNKQ
jgi:hypothetical protein